MRNEMYYTEEEATYLSDLYADYEDMAEDANAILASSANPMIQSIASDVLCDLCEDVKDLQLAFAVGGLVPQGNDSNDTESGGMDSSMAMSLTNPADIDT